MDWNGGFGTPDQEPFSKRDSRRRGRGGLWAFFALTFLISWGVPGAFLFLSQRLIWIPFSLDMYSPLYFIAVWGPAIAAVSVIATTERSGSVRAFFRRMLDWRIRPSWRLFALAGIPTLNFFGAVIEAALGNPHAMEWYSGPSSALAAAFLLRATAGPVEELGWRGFALPRMQQLMHPVKALLLLALIHAVWHAPVFLVGRFAHFGTPLSFPIAFARFAINILIVTTFINTAYNANNGSVTVAFLIHWMLNGVYPWESDGDGMTGQVIATGTAAAIMLATAGRRWLRPENAAKD